VSLLLKRIDKSIKNWKVKVFDFNHQLMKMINVSREDKALLRSTLSARLMPEDEREHIIKHMLLSSCSSFGPKAKNLLSWCPAPTQVKHIDSSTPVGHMSGCSILFSLKIFIKNGFLSRKLMSACGQSEENWP